MTWSGLLRLNVGPVARIHLPVNRPTAAGSPEMPAQDEAAVVRRAQAGDADARDELVRRHLPDVYRVTYGVLGDEELARDAAQDAVVSALRGLSKFRGDSSFRTWLLRIAVNAARTLGRRNGRRHEVPLELAEGINSGHDPARHAERTSEAERLERALAMLPPKQRMAVALRVQQGLSYAEIARVLDCSEGAARVNYHLGVKRLRELVR